MDRIRFDNVSKRFHRSGGQKLLRHYVEDLLGRENKEDFLALDSVSFRIRDGESVAVIGHNGAGKSTLLSLMTGLAPPTSGKITIEGRLAPLLDLGAGFHPDLTGRENVLLNAALLGYDRKGAAQALPAILEFAELHEFAEEPLRTYSSGMVLRLAFSVAANLDPEIMLIDEILAVGDQRFQARCLERIFELRRHGKTMVIVSHVNAVLFDLCDRALWLDHGRLVRDGSVAEVVGAYEQAQAAQAAGEPSAAAPQSTDQPGAGPQQSSLQQAAHTG